MRCAAVALVALLLAAPVSAAELTFENLWQYPDITITYLDFSMYAPDGTLYMFTERFAPVLPDASWTFTLPSALGAGFTFNTLDASGACPQNCGWGSNETDPRAGAWIGGDLMEVNVMWPTYEGPYAPIVRMTYTPDAQPVPEPGTLALLSVGLGAAILRRRRS